MHFGPGAWRISCHPRPLAEFVYQVYHLYGSRSAVIAFVACFGSGPFNGLLDVLRGQTPNMTGTPVVREVWAMPFETSLHT